MVISFPGSSAGRASTCNVVGRGLIPGLGRWAGEGIDSPLQYFWASLVAQMVKNQSAVQETWVWCIGKIRWRREQLSTPIFWPGEFHGQRSLAVYSPWDHKELDTTEWLSLHFKVVINKYSWNCEGIFVYVTNSRIWKSYISVRTVTKQFL